MKLSQSMIPASALRRFATEESLEALFSLFVAEGFGHAHAYLPAGALLMTRITKILDEEIEKFGAVRLMLPQLVSKESIATSKRVAAGFFSSFALPIEAHGVDSFMMPTHEEVVAKLLNGVGYPVGLPLLLYQSGRKFRSESMPCFPIRLAEFQMHDTYSFCIDEVEDEALFERLVAAYMRAFCRIGVSAFVSQDFRDPLFKDVSRELIAPGPLGTDLIKLVGTQRCYKLDVNAVDNDAQSGLEIGHAYRLFRIYESLYPSALAQSRQTMLFGGTGIGIDRVFFSALAQGFRDGAVRLASELKIADLAVVSSSGGDQELASHLRGLGLRIIELDLDLPIDVQLCAARAFGITHFSFSTSGTLELRRIGEDVSVRKRWPLSRADELALRYALLKPPSGVGGGIL